MKIINLFPLSIIQEKILLDKNIKNEMTKEWVQLPQFFITSAKNKKGLEGISSFIKNLNKER